MDNFTRFVVCVPLRNKQATTVAKALVENVFMRYNAIEAIHSDSCLKVRTNNKLDDDEINKSLSLLNTQ